MAISKKLTNRIRTEAQKLFDEIRTNQTTFVTYNKRFLSKGSWSENKSRLQSLLEALITNKQQFGSYNSCCRIQGIDLEGAFLGANLLENDNHDRELFQSLIGCVIIDLPSITKLDLSYNNIYDAVLLQLLSGALYFDAQITTTSSSSNYYCHLLELNLSHNSIGNTGCSALATILKTKNCPLLELDLSYNAIGEAGCKALAKALVHESCFILKLNLSANMLGDGGAKELSISLQDNRCTLRELLLCHCNITDEGLCELFNKLKLNQSLNLLDLHHNEVGDTFCQFIASMLSQSAAIDDLNLGGRFNSTIAISLGGRSRFLSPLLSSFPPSVGQPEHFTVHMDGPTYSVCVKHYLEDFQNSLQEICNKNREVKQRYDRFMEVKPATKLWPTLFEFLNFNTKSDLIYGILHDKPDVWIPPPKTAAAEEDHAATSPGSQVDTLDAENSLFCCVLS